MGSKARVVAVSVSETKGVQKVPQQVVRLVQGHGVQGDAHAGPWHRQVSLLACESIEKMQRMGLAVSEGSFAENIATSGVSLHTLPVGSVLRIGEAVLRVTQIGKECHTGCAIRQQAGDCVMPREGIFAEVLVSGEVRPGDEMVIWPVRRAAVVSLSDRGYRGERADACGPLISEWLLHRGFAVDYLLLADDQEMIVMHLKTLCDEAKVDLVLTTGGTGFSPRDNTPEATRAVIEREAPGLAEGLRFFGLQKTPRAMLSRGVAGLRGQTLIINLPGSPKAVADYLPVLDEVLPHALQVSFGETMNCADEA